MRRSCCQCTNSSLKMHAHPAVLSRLGLDPRKHSHRCDLPAVLVLHLQVSEDACSPCCAVQSWQRPKQSSKKNVTYQLSWSCTCTSPKMRAYPAVLCRFGVDPREQQEGYELLVRKLLKLPHKPAVLVVHWWGPRHDCVTLVSKEEAKLRAQEHTELPLQCAMTLWNSTEDRIQTIVQHYGVQSVSFRCECLPHLGLVCTSQFPGSNRSSCRSEKEYRLWSSTMQCNA